MTTQQNVGVERDPARRTPSMALAVDVPDVSIVMPCLNEAETVVQCVTAAKAALREAGLIGEVIVADNGSSDGSPEVARAHGAVIVPVAERGYGSALIGGITAARARFIVMGDADASYDFRATPAFVERLRAGADLVVGCRLASGGGRILPGAMPFLHRWLGNPMFSALARLWFGAPVHDIYCGLRGFSKELFQRLDLRCTGMEFATEMVIKASLLGARIDELPITLSPDGRTARTAHLRTFRDGWRTLRFFLLCTPGRLFVAPGLLLVSLGLLAAALALPGITIGGITFDAHTLLVGSLALVVGYQTLLFAVIAQTFAVSEGLLPQRRWFARLKRWLGPGLWLTTGVGALVAGSVLIAVAVNMWRNTGFGRLDYAETMRIVVPGVTLTSLGFQTLLNGFVVDLLSLKRR
jgi:hypothetical protein